MEKRNKWKEWLSDLRTGRKAPGKNHLLILFLTGLLLFVAVVPFPSAGEEDNKTESSSSGGNMSGTDMGEYEAYLEKKTEEILRQADGVGEVTVMITLKSDGQKIIEKDQSGTSQTTRESDSAGGVRTVEDTASDKTSIYEQQADGSSVPYVSKELSPEVEGVVVIADGGDDAVAVRSITGAVQALFGVEAHKIKIMKRA